MLNSPSFPLGATLHFLWPHWLSPDVFWVDGTWGGWEGGGELVHPWHVLATRSPQEDSHCCSHATAVASDTQGLAWPGRGLDCFSPMAGAQGQHWFFSPVASQHRCCPGKLSRILVSHLQGVSRMDTRSGSGSGLGSQGPRLQGVSEASDVTPASPRRKRWVWRCCHR